MAKQISKRSTKLSVFLCSLLLLMFAVTQKVKAQDTLRVLAEDEFIAIVKQHHPVAKQAGLLVDAARAQLLSIRGNFDPVVFLNNDQKTFDGKNYFNYTNAELAVPHHWYVTQKIPHKAPG